MDFEKTVRDLMKQEENSFYLYYEEHILQQMAILKECFPSFDFLYSIKTNPFAPIVNTIFKNGFGADAASLKEVLISREQGCAKENIFFSAPGKTLKDIEGSIHECTIIADSLNELKLVNQVAENMDVTVSCGVRLNPDFAMEGGRGPSSKYGIDEEILMENLDFFSSLKNIKIVGVHIHIRSQVLDYEKLQKYYEKVFKLALFCKDSLKWELEFINFGGGIGIPYSKEDSPLDLKLLGENTEKLHEDFKKKLGIRLMIETGRFLVCKAGYFITPVVDIKVSRGVKYIFTAHGLNGFIRPSIVEMLNSYGLDTDKIKNAEPLFTKRDAFEFSVLGSGNISEKVTLAGSLCTAIDVMVSDIYLPKMSISDILVVSNAGSYAYTLTPVLFASQEIPKEIYVRAN